MIYGAVAKREYQDRRINTRCITDGFLDREGNSCRKTSHTESRGSLVVMESPRYTIDLMEAPGVRDIQRKFDIKRETRHLSTLIMSHADVERFRLLPAGRCYYTGSMHITPDISVEAEQRVIAGRDTSKDEGRWWLPTNIAEITGRQRNGLPINDTFWMKHQSYLGNVNIRSAHLLKGWIPDKEAHDGSLATEFQKHKVEVKKDEPRMTKDSVKESVLAKVIISSV